MKTHRALTLVLLLAAAAGGAYLLRRTVAPAPHGAHAPAGAERLYQCPMHPQIVSNAPGTCPICNMQLQPLDAEAPGAPPAGGRRVLFYRHPMRPDVTSPTPAKDEMGMDYVPVYEEDVPAGRSDVPGHAAFTLSTERQQMIGVTRTRVERRPLAADIRAAGRVAYDPALYQGLIEYREALKARREIAQSPWREAHEGADALARAAALKLRRLGIGEAQLRDLARAPGSPENLLLPGESTWVYAQVYEYELDLVRPGQTMVVTTPALPGRTFSAQVAGVDPILDAPTRTARVRGLVATPGGELRPETYVHVRIEVPLGERLAVPEAAVLDTGERQIVFVVLREGEFEPRAVTLGRQAWGYHEVLDGLADGEEVVTSANFLIDSESRFRAAAAAFSAKTAPGHQH